MRIITTEELKQILKKVIDKLEQDKITDIKIENDFYKLIPIKSDFNNFEDELMVGSLFDDVDSLKLIVNDKDRIITYVDFDRLASILRIISEIENPC